MKKEECGVGAVLVKLSEVRLDQIEREDRCNSLAKLDEKEVRFSTVQ
jgi:hypothetical protein